MMTGDGGEVREEEEDSRRVRCEKMTSERTNERTLKRTDRKASGGRGFDGGRVELVPAAQASGRAASVVLEAAQLRSPGWLASSKQHTVSHQHTGSSRCSLVRFLQGTVGTSCVCTLSLVLAADNAAICTESGCREKSEGIGRHCYERS